MAIMAVKGFFASKLNWVGIIQLVMGVLELMEQPPTDWTSWRFVITGVLTIVLRTFFTDTRVQLGGYKGDIR